MSHIGLVDPVPNSLLQPDVQLYHLDGNAEQAGHNQQLEGTDRRVPSIQQTCAQQSHRLQHRHYDVEDGSLGRLVRILHKF